MEKKYRSLQRKLKGTPIIYESEPLNGVLTYIANICGQNKVPNEYLEIKASSTSSSSNAQCEELASRVNSPYWYSNNSPNQWLCFHFLQNTVSCNRYSIKTFDASPGSGHLKSWSFQGSNDGVEWTTLDVKNNCNDLNSANAIATYEIPLSEPYSYFRILNTGRNHIDHDVLIVCGFEVFGILY